MNPVISIRIKGLHFGFEPADASSIVFQCFNADIDLFPDKLTLLHGRNGVGKTVLARLISGDYRPTEGSISFTRGIDNQEFWPHVIYIPQNFELLHDRYAVDLFRSFACSKRFFFNALAFHRKLRQLSILQPTLYSPCDAASRLHLILGSIAAADFAKADLIVVDEPFAHLSSSDRDILDEYLQERIASLATPILAISHPDQTPKTPGNALQLQSYEGNVKQIGAGAPISSKCCNKMGEPRSTRFTVEAFEGGASMLCTVIREKVVNELIAPVGISPGRFAALLCKALKTGRGAQSGKWKLKVSMCDIGSAAKRLKVGLLPSQAQTTVVLSNTELAFSTLFDKWESTPTTPFLRQTDRIKLDENWFPEGSNLLPIQHEDPRALGRTLSGGNRQILALRTVSYPFPDILILVSPLSGLDEANTERAHHFLGYAALNGTVVIAVEGGSAIL